MPTRKQLRKLLELVSATEPAELDCDQFLRYVGVLLEKREVGREPPEQLAALSQHLAVCPECREEFEALLRLYDTS